MEHAILTQEEMALAEYSLGYALSQGASKVRITLNKSLLNLIGVLNGDVDKVSHALDRSLQLALFVDGRFGTFSSNRLDREGLEAFVREAIATVKMLEPDPLRDLPAPERLSADAVTGRELDLYDPAYDSLTAPERREMALRSMAWPRRKELEQGWQLIAEEGEYSDSVFDTLVLDSQGLRARHTETSFEIGYESTVEDAAGNRYANYWWDATPRLQELALEDCARKAALRAAAAIGPQTIPGGKYTLIVDSECASKLVTPLVNALGGYSLQQKNSFLCDSLGKQLFPACLTILDKPRSRGETGSRLFDSEGVATREAPIIEKGVVRQYFLSTYMARKLDMTPTVEDATRVAIQPVGGCVTQEDVLRKVGDGVLVTAFNGGNSNAATGNFSYGIEGFLVKDGKIQHPVHEMLITGNFLTLWGQLVAAAQDARPCMSRLVPTLAFENIDFSA